MNEKSEGSFHWSGWVFIAALVLVVFWRPASQGLCPANEKFLTDTFSQNCFDFLMNRYQTLIGGVLAVVAGVLAFWGLHQQMRQDRFLANQAIEYDKSKSAEMNTDLWNHFVQEANRIVSILEPVIFARDESAAEYDAGKLIDQINEAASISSEWGIQAHLEFMSDLRKEFQPADRQDVHHFVLALRELDAKIQRISRTSRGDIAEKDLQKVENLGAFLYGFTKGMERRAVT